MLALAPSVAAAAVSAAALLSTWGSVRNGFVWDDRAAVLFNRDVSGDGPLSALLAHDFWGEDLRSAGSHKSFRPLTVLSFRLNFLFSGFQPGPYHAVNCLAHVACSLLVSVLARKLLSSPRPMPLDGRRAATESFRATGSLVAGLLFAVHPVHCDAVASIVGRADLLCAMFSLASFIVYMSATASPSVRRGWVLFFAAIALATASCVCKELGFATFGLLAMYDLLLAAGRQSMDRSRAQQWRLALLAALGAVLVALRVSINGEHRQMKWNILANSIAVNPDRTTRLLSYAHTHAWYLWKLVWPRYLSFDYGYATIPVISSVWDARNGLTALAYLAVIAGVSMAVRQLLHSLSARRAHSPALTMSLAFGILPFVPASNIFFPVGTVVAERLLYLPSVGFCLLVALLVSSALDIASKYTSPPNTPGDKTYRRRWIRAASNVITTCCAFVVVAGCLRSRTRNAEWEDESTLFEAALRVAPANVKVLSNTAKTLLQSDPERAISLLRVANGLAPGHVETLVNLGVAFANKEDYLASTRYYAKGINRDAKDPSPPGFLGGTMLNFWRGANRGYSQEDYWGSPTIGKAKELLDHSIYKLSSYFPAHFYNRGLLAYHEHDYEDAIKFFRLTLAGNSAIEKRKMDLELVISEAAVRNLIAACHVNMGDNERAAELLEEGLALFPDELDMRYNLAVVRIRQEKWTEASDQLAAALDIAASASLASKLLEQATHLRGMQQLAAAEAFEKKAAQLLT